MYSGYVREKEGLETLAKDFGFGAYHINKVAKILDIGDFYIKPEHRKGMKSTELFMELFQIAKDNGCKKITCCVELYHGNPEPSLLVVLENKFKYSHVNEGVIHFYKNIKEES